jgi:hypothetical protein
MEHESVKNALAYHEEILKRLRMDGFKIHMEWTTERASGIETPRSTIVATDSCGRDTLVLGLFRALTRLSKDELIWAMQTQSTFSPSRTIIVSNLPPALEILHFLKEEKIEFIQR